MSDDFDLDAYFERIGWGGGTQPNFETLCGLVNAHMVRIPFENLDVLLGRPVRLDTEGLQAKLVRARRGGYCFEHTTLFAAALERLGFHFRRHSGRVTLLGPRREMPRTHMFLTVLLEEGTFVVDPGFGALAPRLPVPLQGDFEVRAGHEAYRMVRDEGSWVLRVRSADKTVDAWCSTLEDDNPVDFEMANHFTSTHPKSPFVNRMMLRAITVDGRIGVMNRDVTMVRGGESTPSQLTDRRALRRLLLEYFGFDLPESERLRVPSIPEWD